MPHKDPARRRACDRERFRRRSAERIALGLCPRCGERPPAPERSVCEPCAARRNKASRARDAKLRDAGTPRRDPETARAFERARRKRQTAERIAAGACTKCGKAPSAPERRLCDGCIGKRRAAERKRYTIARAAGKLYGGANVEMRRRNARVLAIPAPQGPARGRPVHPLRQGPACRGRHGVRTLQGNSPRCRTGAVGRPAGCRLLRQVQCAGRGRQGALHALRRLRGETAAHEKRRQPQPLRPAPGARLMYRLRRDRPGRRGAVRSLRLAVLRALGLPSRHAGVRAALYRDRT